MTIDYKNTVFLPKTEFPMRGNLPVKEPELLARWEEVKLYEQLATRETPAGDFTLHDGPPYANGNIHIGHATNKILKDVVNRAEAMRGKRINYTPGWDCHGLPIEWKIEEQYRAKGQDKDRVPVLQFRQECREFAQYWLNVQINEFKRLGILGAWHSPYATMTKHAESTIISEIHTFLLNGALYQGERSVMWSTVEKTALADAEIEYHDHTSDTVMIGFPITQAKHADLIGAQLVIWTTTPWTMPANRGIAYGAEFDYSLYHIMAVADDSTAQAHEKIIVAKALADAVQQAAKITLWTHVKDFKGSELEDALAAHPLRGHAEANGHYDFAVRVMPADFVTVEAGTGLVHIAPSHGLDDFNLGKQYGLEVPYTVEPDGRYASSLPLFGGLHVYRPDGKKGEANKIVTKAIEEAGYLLAKNRLVHSYPHSWRSKAPLIFRATPQWFIRMDEPEARGAPRAATLRDKALQAISQTKWVPEIGENRIRAMVEGRPDWCISRQRAWGVPIAIFIDKTTRAPLRDAAVCQRIVDIFKDEGSDAWYTREAQDFLGPDYNAADYEQVRDIVDVWFESGCTHSFVLNQPDNKYPIADLYLEGSDQHRGWFQSSLLEACGTRGVAPYKAVLTHGFVLDEQGRKMSKSLGNVTAPQKVIDQYGADILRLWVCNTNYVEDVRIGNDILKQQADLYRRLRNTLRYILGALADSDITTPMDVTKMPELERWVLHRLSELDAEVQNCLNSYDYNRLFTAIHKFCNNDLSAFYFDIRKDCLYCDAADSAKRQATLWVMNQLFLSLTAWLAPILSFTCEEAWQHYSGKNTDSVHLRQFNPTPTAWRDDALAARWDVIRNLRSAVTIELEKLRGEKAIGSSLEAMVTQIVTDAAHKDILLSVDYADICIVSNIAITVGDAAKVTVSKIDEDEKCDRCWRYLPEVGTHPDHAAICFRCADAVVGQLPAAA